MRIRLLAVFVLLVAACVPTPSPEPSVTAEPSSTAIPSVEPTQSAAPSPSDTPEPTPEPTPSPVVLEFSGTGNDVIGHVDLPESLYTVTMKAEATGEGSCSINVALIPDTGDVIEVGEVTSAKGEAVVQVAVPNGVYALEVHDPGCRWSVEIAGE